jgi:hypothetical protein
VSGWSPLPLKEVIPTVKKKGQDSITGSRATDDDNDDDDHDTVK